MAAPKEIEELVEKFNANRAYYCSPDYKEENAKRDFIEPMVGILATHPKPYTFAGT